jgi:hypothetical protein
MKVREAWYLGKVPQKKNRSWTEDEKLKVFTMAEKHHPAIEIAKKFKASVTQIHNVVRLVRKGLKRQCYICGSELTDEEFRNGSGHLIIACVRCKKEAAGHKKLLRKRASKHGLCVYCQTRKALPGHKSCRHCVSATHRRRYVEGLCGLCGTRPIGENKIALCDVCAALSKTRTANYRQKRTRHRRISVPTCS